MLNMLKWESKLEPSFTKMKVHTMMPRKKKKHCTLPILKGQCCVDILLVSKSNLRQTGRKLGEPNQPSRGDIAVAAASVTRGGLDTASSETQCCTSIRLAYLDPSGRHPCRHPCRLSAAARGHAQPAPFSRQP